ncbi:MAG TPA: AAA domain-containing protein, partial [Bacteroidia bacterium]|nr:AAA domain-containing protein [Bacteroidia bacterium]
DLYLGYPFVEGNFLDGSVVRCPVVLVPVRLQRDFQGGPRWLLQAHPEEDLSFNTTFFLAYEKFMQVRLKREFWEDGPERHSDLQGFLNGLYKQMADHDVAVHFNSELFQFRLDHFPEKNQPLLDQLPVGKLRFLPHAVLGIFPQSDSALMQDYEVLESQAESFSLETHFANSRRNEQLPAPKEDERYYVAAVDQSQEEALLHVRAGESVVLHGPPGTGKSQVILNLISDALARGQKVLVCSQKRAALDVVFQRMSEVGLGRFAALVHDYRGDRNKIFARIRQQIDDIERFEDERRDLGLDIWLRDFRRDSRRIDELNTLFEKLFQALTQRGRFGLSAHELYLMADRKAPQLDMAAVAMHFDHESWLGCREKLGSIVGYADFFDEAHPWRFRVSLNRLGFNGKAALREKLAGLPAETDRLHQRWLGLGATGKTLRQIWEIPGVLGPFAQLEALLALPGAKADLAAAVADGLKPKALRDNLEKLGKLFQKMAAFQILDGLPLQLHEDLQRNFQHYEEGQGKFGRLFSTRWLKAWWYVRQLLQRRGRKLEVADLKLLKAEIEVVSQVMALSLKLDAHAFFADMPLTAQPSDLLAWQARKLGNVDVVVAWNEFKGGEAFKPKVIAGKFDETHWRALVADARGLEAILLASEQLGQAYQAWLHPRQLAQLMQGLAAPETAKAHVQALQAAFEQDYDDLCQLDTLLDGLGVNQRLALEHLEPHIGVVEKSELLARAEQGMFQAWLAITETAHPELLEPTSRQMPERQETYRQLVADRVRTVTGLIQRKLKDAILDRIEYNRLSNPVTYREIGHQVRKQRQLWPVRKLVQQFWDEGLSTLIPCWMASPESVSAIFPMIKDHFDLVIFDEASQCYVERALPVMLRGRQCVIAGDDKQLPPFDLYNVKVDEEEDPFVEDQIALEVESILDLARNKFRQCKLSWHYRSSEKELINFSNYAFYEGRLNVVPPARHEPISIPPISFVKVEGVWERNSNIAEARKVVELVEELVKRPDNPTIGI